MNRTWFIPGTLQIKATSLSLVNDPSGFIFAPQVLGNATPSPQMMTIGTGGELGSQSIPSSGVLTLGTVDTNPNVNAAIISGTQLRLEPADATHPGVLSAIAQTIPGPKTFGAAPIFSTGVFGVTPASSQLMTINAAGTLGSVSSFETTYDPAPLGGPSNMLLNVGTITAATVRGVSIASPWPITLDLTTSGKTIFLRIPAFNISATSGGTGTSLSFTGTLAVGYRPTNFVCQYITMDSSSAVSSAANYVTINPTGAVTLVVQTTSWTVGFGLPFDIVVSYIAP